MTKKPATRKHYLDEVDMADKGFVFGVDYMGPYIPDVDGNVQCFVGTETGHTNYGFIDLSPNRESETAVRSFLRMQTELESKSDKGHKVVRIHHDDDPGTFQGTFKRHCQSCAICTADACTLSMPPAEASPSL